MAFTAIECYRSTDACLEQVRVFTLAAYHYLSNYLVQSKSTGKRTSSSKKIVKWRVHEAQWRKREYGGPGAGILEPGGGPWILTVRGLVDN